LLAGERRGLVGQLPEEQADELEQQLLRIGFPL
jgi:hypothetical protein